MFMAREHMEILVWDGNAESLDRKKSRAPRVAGCVHRSRVANQITTA